MMVCTPEKAPIYADEEICESTKRADELLALYTDIRCLQDRIKRLLRFRIQGN